ncbi:MAG TPA: hypothetical protein ENF73_02665, partial [Proteobacteria bacterium]|nr:hypothetical protein [Pseudomonadota bacterium]
MARGSGGRGDRLEQIERGYERELELKRRYCRAAALLDERCHRESLDAMERYLDRRKRMWESSLGFIERTLDRFSGTVGRLFAEGLVDGSVKVERALKSLAKTMIADLITSMIRLSYQQAIWSAKQKLAVAQNAAEAASVWSLVAAYKALAAAKFAAMGPFGFLFHAGGAVVHSGGEIKRAHGGLRADEAVYVLQRGEYV